MNAPMQPDGPSAPLTPTQKMRANLEAMRAQGATAEEQLAEIERWKPKIAAFNQAERASSGGAVGNLMASGATFGFNDEIAGAADAIGAMVPGGQSPGQAYRNTTTAIRGVQDAYRAENPKKALAAELGGGLALSAIAPAARLATGGKLLAGSLAVPKALQATTKLGRLGQTVGAGAASGALAGAGGAEEGNRLRGAAIGGATGAALVLGLAGAASWTKAVARRIGLGPKAAASPMGRAQAAVGLQTADDAAAMRVADAVEAGGRTIDEVLDPNASLDPTAMLADVDVGGQRAMRLAGTGRRLGREAPERAEMTLGARARNRPQKLAGDVARVSGVSRFNPLDEADELVEQARTAAKPLYDEVAKFAAVEDARIADAVDLIPEDRMASLWKGVRDIARGEGRKLSKNLIDPETGKLAFNLEPREMDYLKRALDEIIYTGSRQAKMGQPGGLTNAETRLLQQARQLIVSAAEDATGGPGGVYAQARAVFDGPVSLKRAMEEGLDATKMTQAELERATRGLTPRQKEAFSRGGVESLRERFAGTPPGRANIARNLQDETSRERLRAILGGSADEFDQVLKGEMAREATEQGVLRGSQTAERLADDADMVAGGLPVPSRQGLINAVWGKVAAPFERAARGTTKAEADAVTRLLTENIGDAKARERVLRLLRQGKKARAEIAAKQALRRAGVAGAASTTAGSP